MVDETAIINLSISSRGSALDGPVQDASDAGLIVVIAAANSNVNASEFSPQRLGGSAIRACGLVVVGALAAWSSYALAGYSNFGDRLDMLMSGTVVCAKQATTDDFYVGKTGTSYAAPLVAGILAAFLEKKEIDKCAAVDDMFDNALYGVADVPEDKRDGTPNIIAQLLSALRASTPSPTAASCTTLTPQRSPQPAFTLRVGEEVTIRSAETFLTYFCKWTGAHRKAPRDPRCPGNWQCGFRFALSKVIRPRLFRTSPTWSPRTASRFGNKRAPTWVIRATSNTTSSLFYVDEERWEFISEGVLPRRCSPPLAFDVFDAGSAVEVCAGAPPFFD